MSNNKAIMLHDLPDDMVDSYLATLAKVSFSEHPHLWDSFTLPNYLHDPQTHIVTRVFNNSLPIQPTSFHQELPYWRRHFHDDEYWYKLLNLFTAPYPRWLDRAGYVKTFPEAIEKNFYEGVSMVDAFIYDGDGGNCIGYRMPIMTPMPQDPHGHPTLTARPNREKLDKLIARVVLKSKETGLVLTDFGGFNHSNVMEFEDRYYIIDLEGITTLAKFKQWRMSLFKMCYHAYTEQVEK